MARELQPCGTRAAYSRHRKNGEEACAPCMAANREAGKDARHAHGRALVRLAERHTAEFAALVTEEKAIQRAEQAEATDEQGDGDA